MVLVVRRPLGTPEGGSEALERYPMDDDWMDEEYDPSDYDEGPAGMPWWRLAQNSLMDDRKLGGGNRLGVACGSEGI